MKSFAELTHPLNQLLTKGTPFVWTNECQVSRDMLIDRLTTTPILTYPCPGEEFILDTDASNYGIGAVLSQIQGGEERVIGYYSRSLNKAERNYCVTRKELLAVVAAVEHFHYIHIFSISIYGQKFTVRTDHSALQWLLNFKNVQGQLARWLQKLQQYDLVVIHRVGKFHSNADALSCRPCLTTECQYCQKVESTVILGNPSTLGNSCVSDVTCHVSLVPSNEDVTSEGNSTAADFQTLQRQDEELKPIIGWLEAGIDRPEWSTVSPHGRTTKILWAQWDSLRMHNNCLYRFWEGTSAAMSCLQLIVPKAARQEVLKESHGNPSTGHFGVTKTLKRVKQRFYWHQMRTDVKRWCEKCDMCSSRKGPVRKPRAPLKLYMVGAPMERIAMDIMGPLPMTRQGNKYLLVAMDYFTKWPEAYALPNQEATTVASVLVREFISRSGTPLELHTDQGRNFESLLMKEVCKILGIHKTRTTLYHPQSDGMVERHNRTLASQLSMFVEENQSDWDEHVPMVLMAYRTAVHESTGLTPVKLMMGHELRIPLDLLYGLPPDGTESCVTDYGKELSERLERAHTFARERLAISNERMKNQYDVNPTSASFKRGDNVWLHTPQRKKGLSPKLARNWKGPLTVVKKVNDLVYKIQATPHSKPSIVHRNRLQSYTGPNPQSWIPQPESIGPLIRTGKTPKSGTAGQPSPPNTTETSPHDTVPRRSKRRRHEPVRLGVNN